jgi:hypothetical protein
MPMPNPNTTSSTAETWLFIFCAIQASGVVLDFFGINWKSLSSKQGLVMSAKPRVYSIWAGVLTTGSFAFAGVGFYLMLHAMHPYAFRAIALILGLLVVITWSLVIRSPKMPTILAESSPQTRTAQEMRATAFALIGDLCRFLKEHGKPVEPPPHVSDPYGGLGDVPDDDDIKKGYPAPFSERIVEIKASFGRLAILDTPFAFSSIGDVLGNRDVRNAKDVREIIGCLEKAAKTIDEKFINGIPFELVDCSDIVPVKISQDKQIDAMFTPLQMRAFEIANEIQTIIEDAGNEPEMSAREQAKGDAGIFEWNDRRWKWEMPHLSKYEVLLKSRVAVVVSEFWGEDAQDIYLDNLYKNAKKIDDLKEIRTRLIRLALKVDGINLEVAK